MARRDEKTDRNREIFEKYIERGYSYCALGKEYNISMTRIKHIIEKIKEQDYEKRREQRFNSAPSSGPPGADMQPRGRGRN